MQTYVVKENKNFIGRKKELELLKKINQKNEAQIIICYGRRRVGKTELIEQAFRKSKILKFEGLKGKDQKEEIQHFLYQLSTYTGDRKISSLSYSTWKECFNLLSEYTIKGEWIVYFEELQWMACYASDLISELKYTWDNLFRRNSQLRLILCGSATSFMLTEVVRSQVLYNRSQTVLEVRELNLYETQMLLGGKHTIYELMDIYLCFGGIPEYLKRLKGGPSLLLKAAEESFQSTGFFYTEIDRIFVSQYANRKNYKNIVDFLSHRKFSNREEILKFLGIKSGGKISELIEDLLICRFIDGRGPIALGKANSLTQNSKLVRYQVADAYLRFYYKFIHYQSKAIDNGQFEKSPLKGLNLAQWRKWLGFSFEYWCLNHSTLIADRLGFSDVQYQVGPYYNRNVEKIQKGYQIDLLFDRNDKVMTVCEIKYTDKPVGREVSEALNQKIELMKVPSKKTIQRVLISAAGVKPEVRAHFDRILTLEDLIN